MLLLLLLLLVGSSLHSCCCWSLSLTAVVVGGGGEVGQSVDESSFFRAFWLFLRSMYYVFGLISIMCVQLQLGR